MSDVMNAPTVPEIELAISRTLADFNRSKQRYTRNFSISTQLVDLAMQYVTSHKRSTKNSSTLRIDGKPSEICDQLGFNYLTHLRHLAEHLEASDQLEVEYLKEVEANKASIEHQAIRLRQLVNISADSQHEAFLEETFKEIDADYELPERDPEARATVATYLRLLDN